MLYVVVGVAAMVVGALILWVGTRMLTSPGAGSSGMADGLGNFIDVFDPARARGDQDLRSQKNMGEVLPSADDEDVPVWQIDLRQGTVRVPRQQ